MRSDDVLCKLPVDAVADDYDGSLVWLHHHCDVRCRDPASWEEQEEW